MNDLTHNINNDELATNVGSMVRGTNNDGNYTFEPYSPKSPVTATEGYRVSKVMYKTNTKKGTIAGENSCLIIPKVTEEVVQANIERLTKHVINMLETEQDKLVKGFHLDKVSFVEPADLSIDAIIEALEAVAVSGRINKEMIQTWFVSHVEENLAILFADKLGCSVDDVKTADSKLALTLKVYYDMFGKMASNTTSYQKVEAEKLLQAITVTCDTEESKTDAITVKLVDKLNKMINPVNTMELLGF
ncbi:hypothetical protein KAU11_06790 [Candidatus Babeliales bacterium]|nr:hypothetical protein [Candidatus Babeliales bacterium]